MLGSLSVNYYFLNRIKNLTGSNIALNKQIEDIKKINNDTAIKVNGEKANTEETNKKLADMNKRIYCQSLITKTPQTGNMQWLNKNIVEYYKQALERYNEVKGTSYQRDHDSEDNKSELPSVTGYYNESKVLYDKYISECGNL